MALLVDKTTNKKLQDRLYEFCEYGMTLYYLYEEGRANLKDLEGLFFSEDDEKSGFIYGKIIKKIKPIDLKKSFDKYSEEYLKNDKEEDLEYKRKLNVIYTKKIIDLVIDKSENVIDKTYINTYNYLFAKIENK